MTITTFTGTGFANVRVLVQSVVENLTGISGLAGGTTTPTGTQYMKLIFNDVNNNTGDDIGNLYILESTTLCDPFADDNSTGSTDYDPWRIAFHSYEWANRPKKKSSDAGDYTLQYDPVRNRKSWTAPGGEFGSADEQADTINTTTLLGGVSSLAIYAGTPESLKVKDVSTTGTPEYRPIIGWRLTNLRKSGEVRGWFYDDFDGNKQLLGQYSPGYKGRDFIEPVGNMGAEWSNRFDPVARTVKRTAGGADGNANNQGPFDDLFSGCWAMPRDWDGPDTRDPNQLFINQRYYYSPDLTVPYANTSGATFALASPMQARTLSYRLVIASHGIFLGVWGPDPEENGNGFSWFVIQRPVDKKTGVPRGVDPDSGLPYTPQTAPEGGIGNRPLFCVNCVNGKYYKFTVREHDNYIPGERKDATVTTQDHGAVINPFQQQSLTEDGEYVITFLNNLNSSRFKYGDEMDLVGTVSSDVVGGGNDIKVNVYGEEQDRTYHALWSSGAYGTKMRVMVASDIPTPNTPTPTPTSGSGAVFTISADGAGGYSLDAVTTAGTGYAQGDTITIDGTNLGGTTPTNDATITVSTVNGSGGILTGTISGTSTGSSQYTGVAA